MSGRLGHPRVDNFADVAGIDIEGALDGLRRPRIAVVFWPRRINVREPDETRLLKLAKAPEDGLVGPAAFSLDGGESTAEAVN